MLSPTSSVLELAQADLEGIDQFGTDSEAELYDAVTAAKNALKSYQDFILSIFKPDDVVALVYMRSGGRAVHEFMRVEEAIKPEQFDRVIKYNVTYNAYIGMNAYNPALIGKDKGRSKENVVAIRALYVDADDDGQARLETIRASKLVPSTGIILESSANKYQFIWPVDGIEKGDAEPLLRSLAQTFKTDPAVADIARIMRIPGFVNHKYLTTPPQTAKLIQPSNTRSVRTDFNLDLTQIEVKAKVPRDSKATGESAKYQALGEVVGWGPLERRMNTLPDSRSHVTSLRPGEVVSCPFHEHTDYSRNFGVMASNPALVHCLGRCTQTSKSTWDIVAAVQQFDKLPSPEQAARVICTEENLNFADYFPSDIIFAPATKPSTSKPINTRLVMLRADGIRTKSILWMWDDRIPLGKITLFAGNPDQGKSLVSLYVVAKVTRGEPMFGSAKAVPASDVLILAAEDEPQDTIVPRLMGAGADLSRVYFVKSVLVEATDKTSEEREAQLDSDIREVEMLLDENPNIRLIVIDPISSYLGNTNMNREQEVRRVLNPVKRLAERMGVAVVMIMHFNKNSEGSAISRVGGAMAFVGMSRSSLVFVPDKNDPNVHMMLRLKNNLASTRGGLLYKLSTQSVELDDGVSTQPFVEFTGKVDATAQSEMEFAGGGGERRSPEQGRAPEKRQDAEGWLRDYLADGSQIVDDIRPDSKKAGHKWPTMHRAKDSLGIVPVQVWDEELHKNMWVWSLPESEKPAPNDVTFEPTSTTIN